MSLKRVLFGLFASTIILLTSATFATAEEDIHTDIILINGVAVLADYDQKGEVLKEYAEVPYYFSSYQSHETIVEKTTAKYKGLSAKPHKVFDENHFLAANKEVNSTSHCDFLGNVFNPDVNASVICHINSDRLIGRNRGGRVFIRNGFVLITRC